MAKKMQAPAEDPNLEEEEGQEQGIEVTEKKSWPWQWIAIGLVGILAVWAHLKMPEDSTADVEWLNNQRIAQSDSIRVLAAKQDSAASALVKADSSLLAEIQSRTNLLADSTIAIRISVDRLKRSMISASTVKKMVETQVQSQIKVTAQKAEFTEAELRDLRTTFRVHQETRAKDAHGNKKVASSHKRRGFFWRN